MPNGEPDYAEIPLDPDEIKAAIVLRRDAIAIMMRETAVLRANLQAKIGVPATIAWMAEQATATDDILKPSDQRETTHGPS